MASKKPDGSQKDDGRVRLRVRVVAAHGRAVRFRAGRAFGRDPVEVRVTPSEAAVIEADPALSVARLDG